MIILPPKELPPVVSDPGAGAGCDHGITFDPVAAANLSVATIRQQWPRLYGTCPKGCGFHGIYYASWKHYMYGDW